MWYIILFLVIILLLIEKFINKNRSGNKNDNNEENNIDYTERYIKKEYLLTQTELKFYKVLKNVTDEIGLIVCPQIPLYEIIENINYKDFNRIAKKSIDFVVTETNLKIKLCIELDDYTHKQQSRIKRDKFINELFNSLNIKLLRIPVQNFYNKEKLKIEIEKALTINTQ